jgi:hypothetical protein
MEQLLELLGVMGLAAALWLLAQRLGIDPHEDGREDDIE